LPRTHGAPEKKNKKKSQKNKKHTYGPKKSIESMIGKQDGSSLNSLHSAAWKDLINDLLGYYRHGGRRGFRSFVHRIVGIVALESRRGATPKMNSENFQSGRSPVSMRYYLVENVKRFCPRTSVGD